MQNITVCYRCVLPINNNRMNFILWICQQKGLWLHRLHQRCIVTKYPRHGHCMNCIDLLCRQNKQSTLRHAQWFCCWSCNLTFRHWRLQWHVVLIPESISKLQPSELLCYDTGERRTNFSTRNMVFCRASNVDIYVINITEKVAYITVRTNLFQVKLVIVLIMVSHSVSNFRGNDVHSSQFVESARRW